MSTRAERFTSFLINDRDQLTPTARKVACMIADGESADYIADTLILTPAEVKSMVKAIDDKIRRISKSK